MGQRSIAGHDRSSEGILGRGWTIASAVDAAGQVIASICHNRLDDRIAFAEWVGEGRNRNAKLAFDRDASRPDVLLCSLRAEICQRGMHPSMAPELQATSPVRPHNFPVE